MTPRACRPLPISEACELGTVAEYGAICVEGGLIAARPVVAFEVYGPAERGQRKMMRLLLVARGRLPAPLMAFIPRGMSEAALPQAHRRTLQDIFAVMNAQVAKFTIVAVPGCGGALFLQGTPNDPAFLRIRRYNRRARTSVRL